MAGEGRLGDLAAEVLARVAPVLEIIGSDPVLIALSGGADSAICAWALSELRGTDDLSTCYVDHGWPASSRLGSAAERIAEKLGIAHQVIEVTVPEGASREARARQARYEGLDAVTKHWLATGHTRDDQAETLLLHLIRGTGLDGMAAIRPVRGSLVRPLLRVGRDETRRLAGQLGLEFTDDPANLDETLERNRVRQLLRGLGDGPDLVARLARTTELVRDDLDLIGSLADGLPLTERGGRVGVPAPALAAQPRAVQRRVIRRALRRARGPYAGSSSEVERVLACLEGRAGRQELAGGVVVGRAGPWLWVTRTPEPAEVVVGFEDSDRAPLYLPTGHWRAVFDLEAVRDAGVRPAVSGDVIELAGGGHKAVFDVLAEAGVPSADRPRRPLLTVGDRVAWVIGCRTASWSWVTADTRRYRYGFARLQE